MTGGRYRTFKQKLDGTERIGARPRYEAPRCSHTDWRRSRGVRRTGRAGSVSRPISNWTSILMQMRAEALCRVTDASASVDHGIYGRCRDCGLAISPTRLEALPFAVRCRDCEEHSEASNRPVRSALRRGTFVSIAWMNPPRRNGCCLWEQRSTAPRTLTFLRW